MRSVGVAPCWQCGAHLCVAALLKACAASAAGDGGDAYNSRWGHFGQGDSVKWKHTAQHMAQAVAFVVLNMLLLSLSPAGHGL